jgi:hypothetical protein
MKRIDAASDRVDARLLNRNWDELMSMQEVPLANGMPTSMGVRG